MIFARGVLILMQIQATLRHVIGIGFRRISDILLSDFPATVTNSPKAPAEPVQETKKPRDRSSYDMTEHKTFYIAASGILRSMLQDFEGKTVRELEATVDCSPSTIRATAKKLVEQGALSAEGFPAVYRLKDDQTAALIRLAEYQKKCL